MSKRSSAGVAAFALAVIVALAPAIAQSSGDRVCNVPRKKARLDFTLTDINGKAVRLGAYKGQVILLDFWATWCAPCRIEIPWLIELHRQHRRQGFVVLGVSVDSAVAKIKPFAQALEMNYPVLVGAGREDLSAAYGPFVGFPTSFLIARDGSLCVRHVGLVRKEQLEREIKALL